MRGAQTARGRFRAPKSAERRRGRRIPVFDSPAPDPRAFVFEILPKPRWGALFCIWQCRAHGGALAHRLAYHGLCCPAYKKPEVSSDNLRLRPTRRRPLPAGAPGNPRSYHESAHQPPTRDARRRLPVTRVRTMSQHVSSLRAMPAGVPGHPRSYCESAHQLPTRVGCSVTLLTRERR